MNQAEAKAMIDRAEGRLEEANPEPWIPQDQDQPGQLAGIFMRVEQGHTARGPAWIAVIKSADGVEHSVWLLHSVLRNEFKRQAPRPGEAVAVRWLGRVTPEGGGSPYESYRVVVDRPSAAVDWNAVGDDLPDTEGSAGDSGSSPPAAQQADPTRAPVSPADDYPTDAPLTGSQPPFDDDIPFAPSIV